jgi:hypothetical protein
MDPGSSSSEQQKQQKRDRQLSSTPNILLSNPEDETEEEKTQNQSSIEEGEVPPGMSKMAVPSNPPRLVRQPSINQGYSVINPKTSRQESKGGGGMSPTPRSGHTPLPGGPSGDWHTITDADFPGL